MSFDPSDAIGLAGSALFIAAFTYANFSASFDKVLFNLANLVGAAFLLISLWSKFNLAAFVLEAAWALIALAGLAAAWRHRGAAR